MLQLYVNGADPPVGVASAVPLFTVHPVTVADTVTEYPGMTVTDCDAVALQPLPLSTVTIYTVPEVGLTTSAALVAPVFQEYDAPPEALSVVVFPLQRTALPVMVAVGEAVATTVTAAVSAGQLPLETMTE